jgi:hypothetical protein
MRQTRNGKEKALACGLARVTGNTIVAIEAESSADPSEISHFITPYFDGSDFRQESQFAEGGVLEEFSNA